MIGMLNIITPTVIKLRLLDRFSAFSYPFPAFRKLFWPEIGLFSGLLGHKCPNLSTFGIAFYLLLKLIIRCDFKFQVLISNLQKDHFTGNLTGSDKWGLKCQKNNYVRHLLFLSNKDNVIGGVSIFQLFISSHQEACFDWNKAILTWLGF